MCLDLLACICCQRKGYNDTLMYGLLHLESGEIMQVTYLYHSGYFVETETAYFLFDYYKGTIPEMVEEKPLVVFVSHSHVDHYNREIYHLLETHPDTRYILAKDIPTKKMIAEWKEQGIDLEPHITSIRKNTTESLELSNGKRICITTLKSTDAGVAYLVDYENQTIYHAGDLNLWYWEGESKQYNDNMTKGYLREMEKLRGKHIDVAFVPLDPRLELHAFDGMKIFMEYTDCRQVYPMHMWEDYRIIQEFVACNKKYRKRIVDIVK